MLGSLIGCATHRGSLYEEPNTDLPRPHCGSKITISDERKNITTGQKLHIPTFTMPGDNGQVRPEMPIDLLSRYNALLKQTCAGFESQYTYQVRIVGGFMAFKATLTSEREIAGAKLSVQLIDAANKPVREWTGDRTGTRSSIDADEKTARAMLDKAYDRVFIDALYALTLR
jgi:hypothetical protein